MSSNRELSPREFLMSSEFSPERAEILFPNARRLTYGGLFISHSGEDRKRISEQIIDPVVFPCLPADGYFLHSRRSGAGDSYKQLVQAALHWCDKFMLVISRSSVCNRWVHAEVEWALAHQRPVLAIRFDDTGWLDILRALEDMQSSEPTPCVQLFDFGGDLTRAQQTLAAALDELSVRLPCGRSFMALKQP